VFSWESQNNIYGSQNHRQGKNIKMFSLNPDSDSDQWQVLLGTG